MAADRDRDRDKTIVGYCEPWSLRAGERIVLHASSHVPGPAELDLVRLVCGDRTRSGPGFEEHPVATALPAEVDLDEQPLTTGSWGEIDLGGIAVGGRAVVTTYVMATRPQLAQTAWAVLDRRGATVAAIGVDDGRLVVSTGDTRPRPVRPTPIEAGRWYRVEATISVEPAELTVSVVAVASRSPGRDLVEPDAPSR